MLDRPPRIIYFANERLLFNSLLKRTFETVIHPVSWASSFGVYDWDCGHQFPPLSAKIIQNCFIAGNGFAISNINRHNLIFVFFHLVDSKRG